MEQEEQLRPSRERAKVVGPVRFRSKNLYVFEQHYKQELFC